MTTVVAGGNTDSLENNKRTNFQWWPMRQEMNISSPGTSGSYPICAWTFIPILNLKTSVGLPCSAPWSSHDTQLHTYLREKQLRKVYTVNNATATTAATEAHLAELSKWVESYLFTRARFVIDHWLATSSSSQSVKASWQSACKATYL